MKVLIGERIKELRKRDSRKQEDLATAIGVTPQAVSRWEAGTCYPDMGMLPAIANYFHVSIDSLFGYQNDREKKIQEYVLEANRRIFDYEDSAETIRFLRKCLEEFPAEPKLQSALACILQFKGRCEEEKRNTFQAEDRLDAHQKLAGIYYVSETQDFYHGKCGHVHRVAQTAPLLADDRCLYIQRCRDHW